MAEMSTELAVINDISYSLSLIEEKVYNIVPVVRQAFDVTLIQNVNHNLYQYVDKMLNIENVVVNVNSQMEKAEKQTEKVAKKGDLLSSAYKKVASAVKKINVQDVLNKSDELAQTMSRLSQINDGSKSSSELFDMIYASAKNAHAPLMSTADAIITMGNSTGNLFGNNQELVDFMNQLNKQFVLGGASTQEQSSALQQLNQSMASGVLKGTELNKILDAAPGIASVIEKNMGWAEGSLMSYANQGAVTAEVVKASLLNMSDETNEAFENMPLTFSQVMTDLQSDATRIFQPVLQELGGVTQSEVFGSFITSATNGIAVVANIMIAIMDAVGSVAGYIYDNWSVISPLIYGAIAALGIYMLALGAYKAIQVINGVQKVIATVQEYAHAKAILASTVVKDKESISTAKATVAQASFNTTLLASPVTWITIAIIALVVALVALANWIAKTTGIAETGFGVIAGAVAVAGAFIWNIFIGLLNGIIQFAWTRFVEPWIGIIEFVLNVFNGGFNSFGDMVANLIGNVISWFLSLGKVVTKIIDAIFGMDWTSGLESLQNEVLSWGKNENAITIDRTAPEIGSRLAYGETWDTGVTVGDNIGNKLGDLIPDYESPEYNAGEYDLGIPDTTQNDIAATADNTASLNDSVDISNENLKYLKDVAERDAINRFTTAPIKLTMNNHNNISSNMDLDGVINYLTIGMTDTINQAAEGVHA